MRAFMSTGQDHGGPYDVDGLLADAAVREARRILAETESESWPDVHIASAGWLARVSNPEFGHAVSAGLALADALRAFVGEGGDNA